MSKFTGMKKQKIFIEDAQFLLPRRCCPAECFLAWVVLAMLFSLSLVFPLHLCDFHPLTTGGMLWAGSAREPALQAGRICVCRGLLKCSKTVAGAWHRVKHYEESKQIGLGGMVRRHKYTNTSCQAHHICSETLTTDKKITEWHLTCRYGLSSIAQGKATTTSH